MFWIPPDQQSLATLCLLVCLSVAFIPNRAGAGWPDRPRYRETGRPRYHAPAHAPAFTSAFGRKRLTAPTTTSSRAVEGVVRALRSQSGPAPGQQGGIAVRRVLYWLEAELETEQENIGGPPVEVVVGLGLVTLLVGVLLLLLLVQHCWGAPSPAPV